jgi:kynurenine formamidase
MTEQVETAHDALDEYVARYSNWERWGRDDQCGTANHITPAMVRDAAALVRTGQVVGLGLEFNQNGPQTGANGRFNCLRYSVATGSDHALGRQAWAGGTIPRQMGYADDTVVLHLQSATHWDSLSHIFHKGRMYNGWPADEFTAAGAARNGAEALRAKLAELARVHIGTGDIVLLRTGQMARCFEQGWGTYAGGDAPGLSFFTIPWLANRNVAAVATDTWGVEVRPNELPDSFQPFHIPTVVYMGLLLGEMFDLEQLAEACADDGRYEMLVSAPPLAFTGTAGAPPGPVAIR